MAATYVASRRISGLFRLLAAAAPRSSAAADPAAVPAVAPVVTTAADSVPAALPDAGARAGVVDDGGSPLVASALLPRTTGDSSGPTVAWAPPATSPATVATSSATASGTPSRVAVATAAPAGRPTVDAGGHGVTAAPAPPVAVAWKGTKDVGVRIVAFGEHAAAADGAANGTFVDAVEMPTVVLEASGAAAASMPVTATETSTAAG